MNKIRLLQLPGGKFLLQVEDPNLPPKKIICEPQSNDLHKRWVHAIKEQLMLQQKLMSRVMYPIDDKVDERLIAV